MPKLLVSMAVIALAACAIAGCGKDASVAMDQSAPGAPAVGKSWPGQDQAAPADRFAYATLRAARAGRIVTVQVGFQQMPAWVNTLTLGLRLEDGSAVYPTTVRSLRDPDRELLASPEVAFRLGRGVIAPAESVRATRWIETTFELDAGDTSVDGSLFSLLLGDPESVQGCDLGMSVSLSAKDDSPSLYSCILLKPDFGADLLLNLPPAPRPDVPVASFRLSEKPGRLDGKELARPTAMPAGPVPLAPQMLPPAAMGQVPGPIVSQR